MSSYPSAAELQALFHTGHWRSGWPPDYDAIAAQIEAGWITLRVESISLMPSERIQVARVNDSEAHRLLKRCAVAWLEARGERVKIESRNWTGISDIESKNFLVECGDTHGGKVLSAFEGPRKVEWALLPRRSYSVRLTGVAPQPGGQIFIFTDTVGAAARKKQTLEEIAKYLR